MQELIELRNNIEGQKEKAEIRLSEIGRFYPDEKHKLSERISAFSFFIEKLDLILNNSVVKPSERRSPTDESFSGCKPPERKAKSTEETVLTCSNCKAQFSPFIHDQYGGCPYC